MQASLRLNTIYVLPLLFLQYQYAVNSFFCAVIRLFNLKA